MSIIDNCDFLEKNYESKSSYKAQNTEEKLASIEINNEGLVLKETFKNGTIITFEYDEKGNITLEKCTQNNKVLYNEKYKYEFDDKGYLSKSYYARFEGEETNSNWQIIEEYDQAGTVISIQKDYEGDGNIDYIEEYDALFNTRTKKIYDANGKIINIQYYEYDENGKLKNSKYDRDGDGSIEYEVEY